MSALSQKGQKTTSIPYLFLPFDDVIESKTCVWSSFIAWKNNNLITGSAALLPKFEQSQFLELKNAGRNENIMHISYVTIWKKKHGSKICVFFSFPFFHLTFKFPKSPHRRYGHHTVPNPSFLFYFHFAKCLWEVHFIRKGNLVLKAHNPDCEPGNQAISHASSSDSNFRIFIFSPFHGTP